MIKAYGKLLNLVISSAIRLKLSIDLRKSYFISLPALKLHAALPGKAVFSSCIRFKCFSIRSSDPWWNLKGTGFPFIETGIGILKIFRMRKSTNKAPITYETKKITTKGSVLNSLITIASIAITPIRRSLTLGEVLRKVLKSSVEIPFRLFDSSSVSSKSKPGECFKSQMSTMRDRTKKNPSHPFKVFRHKYTAAVTKTLRTKSAQLKFVNMNLFNVAFMCMTPFSLRILSQNALKTFQFLTLNQSRRSK